MDQTTKLYNVHIPIELFDEATAKLERLNGKQTKGQVAAYIRVCLRMLAATPDEQVSKHLLEAVMADYTTTAIQGRRSRN